MAGLLLRVASALGKERDSVLQTEKRRLSAGFLIHEISGSLRCLMMRDTGFWETQLCSSRSLGTSSLGELSTLILHKSIRRQVSVTKCKVSFLFLDPKKWRRLDSWIGAQSRPGSCQGRKFFQTWGEEAESPDFRSQLWLSNPRSIQELCRLQVSDLEHTDWTRTGLW